MQEQEKQRSSDKKKEEVDKKSLEKKKEEMDDEVHKLHVKLKQEQLRWDRECVAREKQQVNLKWFTSYVLCYSVFLIVLNVTFLHAFPEREWEPTGGARATLPPGGRAPTLWARAAGGPAAGVSAKCGQTEGGTEECGEREGESGSPAEGTAELEA